MGRIRTPTVQQMEASECGAACLAILLRHYGRQVSLLELREVCGVSRDGSDAASLLRGGAHYGLEGKGFRMEISALRQRQPPVILFWEFNHFVVLEGFEGGRVAINDPAIGPRWVSEAAFDEAFTGVVLEMHPGQQRPSLQLASASSPRSPAPHSSSRISPTRTTSPRARARSW
jgi:ABC-type bacteriocin/lantibiotic exporter with double-glycine peptidase domain